MKRLETERLILREWALIDVKDLYEYSKNPVVGYMAGWYPHKNIDESSNVLYKLINKRDSWAIELKENHKVIGYIGLNRDPKRTNTSCKMLSYALSQDYWGKGLTFEAVVKVLKYAFLEKGIDLISVYHYDFNYQSQRVIEKSGFYFEGVLRHGSRLTDGQIADDYCYSLTKDEYLRINTITY